MADEHLWGTDHLEKRGRFKGKIVSAEWKKGREFGGNPAKEHLVLEIAPTSYDGRPRFGFYPYSLNERSKWARLQIALENCGIKPKSEQDILGLEFEWDTLDIEYGTDINGNQIIARNTLLPIKLISKPKKESMKVTEEKFDLEHFVLETVKKEPMHIDTLAKLAKEHNIDKARVKIAVKKLESQGKVVVADDIVAIAE
jgi:hypothetical protein